MEADSTILYLHGFSSGPQSNKAVLFRKEFSRHGINLIIPDLEGGSFRNLTISSQMNIIRNVIYQNPSSKYGVIGSSMGGYLALLTAETQPLVTTLFLMCPGINFVKRWQRRLGFEYPHRVRIPSLIQVFNFRYNKVMDLSSEIFCDAKRWEQINLGRQISSRLVHGMLDDVVPIEESRNYVQKNFRAELVELKSDHGLLSHSNWIAKDAVHFFKLHGF
ncbi:MAG: hypothetical protein G3M70_15325 [Candidatus Nitronauta litoralis]|uniref:Esterase n=1 Tax=Candidatus Nitronauta litoralis TaxID=2705533 RepID=A0A7T0G138_9BACT|nr:MAG: hypothetical protein G3M70_15325 [Candidatus Nitronauta litoralis]